MSADGGPQIAVAVSEGAVRRVDRALVLAPVVAQTRLPRRTLAAPVPQHAALEADDAGAHPRSLFGGLGWVNCDRFPDRYACGRGGHLRQSLLPVTMHGGKKVAACGYVRRAPWRGGNASFFCLD